MERYAISNTDIFILMATRAVMNCCKFCGTRQSGLSIGLAETNGTQMCEGTLNNRSFGYYIIFMILLAHWP